VRGAHWGERSVSHALFFWPTLQDRVLYRQTGEMRWGAAHPSKKSPTPSRLQLQMQRRSQPVSPLSAREEPAAGAKWSCILLWQNNRDRVTIEVFCTSPLYESGGAMLGLVCGNCCREVAPMRPTNMCALTSVEL
jgi:hypothetical protein